ncbi:hypothetical protein ACH4GE_18995 [Streptomyces tendae]|uniref:hypothetical protein n=1 Tax=Streptomyces TaxID=1883 RepID=UPI00378851E7
MPRALDPAIVDRLATLYRAGTNDAEAARIVGISKSTAGMWRRRLAIGPAPKQPSPLLSPLTLAEKWHTFARPVEGGHMEWTGPVRESGTMAFTHHGREYTARAAAFRIRTGRAPVGRVTAECEHPGCVAPACVEDDPGRARSRAQYSAVVGRATPLTECTAGHPTATHRRYDRNGRPYCAACHANAAARRKAAR